MSRERATRDGDSEVEQCAGQGALASMDSGVRGPRWHQLTFPVRAFSHLKLAGLLLRRRGREWRWRGDTPLAHLNPVPSSNRASPSTYKQQEARIHRARKRAQEYPNTRRVWELSMAECRSFTPWVSFWQQGPLCHGLPVTPAPPSPCSLWPQFLRCLKAPRRSELFPQPQANLAPLVPSPVSHAQSLLHY